MLLPRCLDGAQEELAPICARSGIGHGQDSRSSVFQGEVLVGKLLSVDALTTGTITSCEVSTLQGTKDLFVVKFDQDIQYGGGVIFMAESQKNTK